MGYYTFLNNHNMFLDRKYFDEVYKKMCELNDYDELKRGGMLGSNNDTVEGERYPKDKWFSWMDYNYPETCKNMIQILEQIGFDIETDNDGNLIGLGYNNKSGNEDYFLSCFAGYIKDGSFIEWTGEDSEDRYRFVFKDGIMIKEEGQIAIKWEESEKYEFGKMNNFDLTMKNWREEREKSA